MIAVLSLFLMSVVPQTATTIEPALFYGLGSCLAVTGNQRLSEGERLIILTPDAPAGETPAGPVRTPSEGADCWREFSSEQPAQVSSLSLPEPLRFEVFFGVRRARDLLIVSGPAVRLPADDAAKWAREVSSSLPEAWRDAAVLVHAYGYGPTGSAPAAVELYLGLPVWNAPAATPAMASVTIRRFFIVGGRMLASEQYERVSGREERAETAPPELSADNWSASETERTVGFLGTDQGRSWTRLSTNVGFEGIWWIAQALRPGLPRTFEQYLYTHH